MYLKGAGVGNLNIQGKRKGTRDGEKREKDRNGLAVVRMGEMERRE